MKNGMYKVSNSMVDFFFQRHLILCFVYATSLYDGVSYSQETFSHIEEKKNATNTHVVPTTNLAQQPFFSFPESAADLVCKDLWNWNHGRALIQYH